MRITAAGLVRIRGQLTETDWKVIETLDRVDTAASGQLRRLHWPEEAQARQARRRLSHLAEMHVVTRLERRIGGVRSGSDGHIYRLDTAGKRLLGQRAVRRTHEPGIRFLDHALAVTEVYVRAIEASRADMVEVVAYSGEPDCWRTWGTGTLRPDAHLVTRTPNFEDHWFIEVDRATESTKTVARKAGVYDQYYATGLEQEHHGLFPRVLWVVPGDHRRNQLLTTKATKSAHSPDLHQIVTEQEIPGIFKP